MINKKEILVLLVSIIILSISLSLINKFQNFFYLLLSISLIIFANIIGKKFMAEHLDSEIEIRTWEVERYGFAKGRHFNKPIPMGFILPLFTSILSFGYVVWLSTNVFEVKPKPYKVGKRHGLYSFSEMTESHIGMIATMGIIANLILLVIGYLIGLPREMNFVSLSVFYMFFNLIPLSDLDGNKIFFGSRIVWWILTVLILLLATGTFLIQ